MVKELLIVAFIICTALTEEKDNAAIKLITPIQTMSANIYQDIVVGKIVFPKWDYYPSSTVQTKITLYNAGTLEKEQIIEYNIYDKEDNIISNMVQTVITPGKSNHDYRLRWTVPEDIITGRYYAEIIVWEQEMEETDREKILQKKDKKGFLVYQVKDNFLTLEENRWAVSSHKLGRSKLLPQNVAIEDGALAITLPSNSLNGGEIYTKDLQSYGVYEVRMKLPKAPSSITGFFLYMAPDYYYEIDIEVVNDSKGTLYFTTYDNGEMRKHFAGTLGFDPTKKYHKYRMEYLEDSLCFYIDNILIKEWKQGYPKAEMQLYINCWYPKWLEGIKPESDQKLLIDWIKY